MSRLKRQAESIGSSTRIEGSKLSNRDVEHLLGNLEIKSFATRDEQEVAGYAEVMDTIARLAVVLRLSLLPAQYRRRSMCRTDCAGHFVQSRPYFAIF